LWLLLKNVIIKSMIPVSFKPLLWSYDFTKIDEEKDKKTIILSAINYGSLTDWRWIVNRYGREEVIRILKKVPVSEIKTRARKLASVVFSINDFNYEPRSVNR